MSSAVLGVIDDARGRWRRRRATVAVLAVFAGIGGGLIFSRAQNQPTLTTASIAIRVAPAAVLAQPPFMGVACRSRSCDSVGLSVWLRQPAITVSATIAGHPMTLAMTNAYPRAGARATFVGYLRPYRLITRVPLLVGEGPTTWDTNGAWPSPPVVLRIDYGNNKIRTTRLLVQLQPGWG